MARICYEQQIRNFKKKLLNLFKKQMTITCFIRNKINKSFISKLHKDELISIFEYKHQIISCRECGKPSKAYLSKSIICISCHTNLTSRRKGVSVVWSTWGDTFGSGNIQRSARLGRGE